MSKDNTARYISSLDSDWFDFEKFQLRDSAEQHKVASSIFNLEPNQIATINDLGHFLQWTKENKKHRIAFNKHRVKKFLVDSQPQLLAQNPSIGLALKALYWDGNKRQVKKAIRKMLNQDNPNQLSTNPSLPIIIHLANLAHLHTPLVKFGANLIVKKSNQILTENPSIKSILLELEQAKIYGIREFVDSTHNRPSRTLSNTNHRPARSGAHHSNKPEHKLTNGTICPKLIDAPEGPGIQKELYRGMLPKGFHPQFRTDRDK